MYKLMFGQMKAMNIKIYCFMENQMLFINKSVN